MRQSSVMTVLLVCGVATLGRAQEVRPHQGFYLSTSISGAGGDINQDVSNGPYSHATFSGAGLQLDLRVGGAVAENNLLSFDISSRAMASPSLDIDGQSTSLDNSSSVGDAIFGVGFTHYFMPANAFVGVTAGLGSFTFDNGNQSGSSKRGFGYILRGGKEWRLGRKWGLGVVGGLAHLSANDKADPDYPGYASTFTTTRVFVGFSATLN